MTTHHLELSDEVYRKLQKAAETERVSPEEWIDARPPRTPTDVRPLSEALKSLLGVVDSRTDFSHELRRSTVGDSVDKKEVAV